jgi:hypothetical protein
LFDNQVGLTVTNDSFTTVELGTVSEFLFPVNNQGCVGAKEMAAKTDSYLL